MRKLRPVDFKPWMLPLLVVLLVVPISAATLAVGAEGALVVGALTVGAIAVVAVRTRFDEPIEVASPTQRRYHVLTVAMKAIEDPRTVEEIESAASTGAAAIGAGSGGDIDVLVLAPAEIGSLDRWASDVGGAREAAQRRLAVSIGALAAASLDAHGAVGDEDPIQAVEDTLRTYPAHEVVFVTAEGDGGYEVSEVRRRLDRPVQHLRERQDPALRS